MYLDLDTTTPRTHFVLTWQLHPIRSCRATVIYLQVQKTYSIPLGMFWGVRTVCVKAPCCLNRSCHVFHKIPHDIITSIRSLIFFSWFHNLVVSHSVFGPYQESLYWWKCMLAPNGTFCTRVVLLLEVSYCVRHQSIEWSSKNPLSMHCLPNTICFDVMMLSWLLLPTSRLNGF